MSKKYKIPGVTFSLNRALGITKAKRNISRKTGIPLSKSGRRVKAGRMIGCIIPILIATGISILIIIAIL